MIWAEWWIWLAAALVLAIAELLAPAFILLGFAIGAAVTGIAVLTDIAWLTSSLPRLLVLFAAVSLLAWLGLRRVVGVRKGQVKVWDTDIND
ncbi:MAG: NfeD family protein [Brevirhabdus sp.]